MAAGIGGGVGKWSKFLSNFQIVNKKRIKKN